VAESSLSDARHIAIATVERVDILVSWNYKHIVNINRIRLLNSVNLKLGYTLHLKLEVQGRCFFMQGKKFDAVEMKRQLQKEAELKLSHLSEKEQLELLHRKFGHLVKQKVR